MSLDAWISVAVVVAVLVVLAATRLQPYLVILAGVVVMLVGGVVSSASALAGFANEGVITVAALFVVAAGLTETGAISAIVQGMLGAPRTALGAQARMMLPVAAASSILNNTPIVAMLMPVVNDWSQRIRVPASQLLIPLSYAAILGGMCTLIGTSTNLVVHGLLLESGHPGLHFFEIAWIGVPSAVAGVAFVLLFGRRLLPWREEVSEVIRDPREYTLEMVVEPGGALVGKTISQAALRHLPGVYLMEIHRRGRVRPAIGPDERLDADDQLVFVGVVDSVVDLQKIPGLRPATTQLFKLDTPRSERWFVEAVISHNCPLIGKTIREGRFRNRYNAVVIGVARGGTRLNRRIGDIVMQAGDVLLLEALPAFIEQQRNSNDFYLVSRIADSTPPAHDRAWMALVIVGAMIVLATTQVLSILQAALAAAAAMLVTRCCSEEVARRRVDWPLVIAIAASFGLGHALRDTGAANTMAEGILSYAGDRPVVALILLYGITMALSAVVTNNAAAVLMFPLAVATAERLGVSVLPFAIVLMAGASASFATPLGYQTNLMVYGPGRYRFADFFRIGLPLSLVLWAVAVLVAPRVWPF
jgi:di/tricarboxylate transporter